MRIFRFALLSFAALALVSIPASADVIGTAFGFAQRIEPNFDGLGSCRLYLVDLRLSVVDFPPGELADACVNLPAPVPSGSAYVEVSVTAIDPFLCCASDCPKAAQGGHYLATSIPR